jgi:hypothetical protein
VRRIGEAFEHHKKRRALLVMATGTGKTRVAMALADVFLRSNCGKKADSDKCPHIGFFLVGRRMENGEWRMECGRGCLGFNGTDGTDGTDGTGVGGERPQEDPKGFSETLRVIRKTLRV